MCIHSHISLEQIQVMVRARLQLVIAGFLVRHPLCHAAFSSLVIICVYMWLMHEIHAF